MTNLPKRCRTDRVPASAVEISDARLVQPNSIIRFLPAFNIAGYKNGEHEGAPMTSIFSYEAPCHLGAKSAFRCQTDMA